MSKINENMYSREKYSFKETMIRMWLMQLCMTSRKSQYSYTGLFLHCSVKYLPPGARGMSK